MFLGILGILVILGILGTIVTDSPNFSNSTQLTLTSPISLTSLTSPISLISLKSPPPMHPVDFTRIIAWQKGHSYVLLVYSLVKSFPAFERLGLVSQFTRAAVSITANIAEGAQKVSKADKLRFLNISQGSLSECRNYNILSKDLNYISIEDYRRLEESINLASFFLNKYIEGIENNSFNQ